MVNAGQEMGELVLFRKCADNIEASGLRALLDANDIYCIVQGEHHRAMLGMLGAYIELNVLVPKTQLEVAHRVVAEAEALSSDGGDGIDSKHGDATSAEADDARTPSTSASRAMKTTVVVVLWMLSAGALGTMAQQCG